MSDFDWRLLWVGVNQLGVGDLENYAPANQLFFCPMLAISGGPDVWETYQYCYDLLLNLSFIHSY